MLIMICTFIVLVILITWVVKIQNKLVHAEELCGNALSQIGVQQASRWDALTALADLTKGYSQQEYQVLLATIAARKSIGSKASSADAQLQENLLSQSFGRLHALAEAYPDLKSNTVYLKTMAAVEMYEEKVRLSRMVYNDTVTKFNRNVRTFPGSLIAGILGFKILDYLEDNPVKVEIPNMNFQEENFFANP